MKPPYLSLLCVTLLLPLAGCDQSVEDPNTLYSEKQQDPIKELEVTSNIDLSKLAYQQTF